MRFCILQESINRAERRHGQTEMARMIIKNLPILKYQRQNTVNKERNLLLPLKDSVHPHDFITELNDWN